MLSRFLVCFATLGVLSLGSRSSAWAEEAAPSQASAAPAGGAQLSDGARVEKAITQYQSGQYGGCARELSTLLEGEPRTRLADKAAIEKARLWLATCLIGDGQPAQAETVLEKALRARPGMRTPDPLTYPRATIDLFIQAQDRLRFLLQSDEEKRIQAAQLETAAAQARVAKEEQRVARLEIFATTESVEVKNRRWISALPFGVGQFQNDKDELGWVLLSAEVVLGGAALVSTVAFVNLQTEGVNALNSRSNATERAVLNSDVNRELRAWHTVATISAYGFFATAIGGILEAQLNFVPASTFTRRRELPRELQRNQKASSPVRKAPQAKVKFTPHFIATDRDFFVGVGGRF